MNWRANVPSLKQFRVVTDLRGAKEQQSKEGSACRVFQREQNPKNYSLLFISICLLENVKVKHPKRNIT